MKKFGLFLIKNSASVLALYFLCWAIWAGIHWSTIDLVQKLLIGMFFLFVLHEYEEAYKERFVAMMGRAVGFTPETLPIAGLAHVPADTFIVVLFTLALVFHHYMWLVFPTFILCFFEVVMHNWGIVMFRLKGVTPGWYTAMSQGAFAIYALVLINRHVDYAGIQWIWAILVYISGFVLMEICTLKSLGKPIREIKSSMQTFIKKRFRRT